jgi:hypothetical protein
MEPIETIEEDGYRILKYDNGSEATGLRISGTILFYEKKAHAYAPVTARLSAIGTGAKNKGYFRPKDDDGNISLNALWLILLNTPEKPEYLREELIFAINRHAKSTHRFTDNWEKEDHGIFYGSAYDTFEKVAQRWLLRCFRRGGSQAMIDAGNLMEKIEKHARLLEEPEVDFLSAVSDAASETLAVPTKDAVWVIWKKDHPVRERQRKQFDKTIKRLGFEWLPNKKPKRGKNAHSK